MRRKLAKKKRQYKANLNHAAGLHEKMFIRSLFEIDAIKRRNLSEDIIT
jgi:hypothetical protein